MEDFFLKIRRPDCVPYKKKYPIGASRPHNNLKPVYIERNISNHKKTWYGIWKILLKW